MTFGANTLALALRQIAVEDYCTEAAATLIIYEYFCTLSQEVRCMWSKKFSIVSVLFFVNRYALLIWAALNSPPMTTYITIKSCIAVNVLIYICDILLSISWAVFIAFRVYTLSNRSWFLALPTLVFGLVPLGANLFQLSRTIYTLEDVPYIGTFCVAQAMNISINVMFELSITTRGFAIASDLIALAVTWFRHHELMRYEAVVSKSTIMTVLVRNGTLYFFITFFLNVLDLSLFLSTTSETITGSFINPIGSIIISRFVLDLREVGLSMNSGSEEQATIGDMEFTTQFDLPISSSSLPL